MDHEPGARGIQDKFNRYRGSIFGLTALLIVGIAVVWFASGSTPQKAETEHVETEHANEDHAEEGHADEGHEAEESGIVLTAEQRQSVGILTVPIQSVPLPRIFRAPGEVRSNDYTTGIVGPRITSTIIARTARLGDSVIAGQPLVTLYSTDMAEAQGAFLLAQRNVERLKNLEDIVAEQQIDEAVVQRQQARGRLESYGLTVTQISALLAAGFSNDSIGQFVLTAPQGGTITKDEFRVGDVVEAGKSLFEIADLQNVWVEAHVSPALLPEMVGEKGLIIAGNLTREAVIVQRREIVDETTRTVGVRLQVNNSDGVFKPGQFVDVELYGASEPVLAVPTEAVQRNPDGDWAVYTEREDVSFGAYEIEVLYTVDDHTAISGIPEGTKVVTSGAFYVASEAAKAGFEIHNH